MTAVAQAIGVIQATNEEHKGPEWEQRKERNKESGVKTAALQGVHRTRMISVNTSGFMDGGDEWNWAALDAMWCLKELLELKEDAAPFRELYEQLKNHPCKCTRQQTRRWLRTHFETKKQSTIQ